MEISIDDVSLAPRNNLIITVSYHKTPEGIPFMFQSRIDGQWKEIVPSQYFEDDEWHDRKRYATDNSMAHPIFMDVLWQALQQPSEDIADYRVILSTAQRSNTSRSKSKYSFHTSI